MARKRAFSISLTKEERKLIRTFQKKTQSSNARTRCTILLEADTSRHPGRNYKEIASAAGSCTSTVITVLKEYISDGFTKMITPNRNPNSNTARLKVTGDVEAKIIATACGPKPKGRVYWTLTLLYNQMMGAS